MLLGILTLGAASAADDVASDNMTSTDLGEDDLSDTPANNDEMLSISDNDDNLDIEEEPILSKATPTINVDVDDGYYGQDISLNVELESDATGNITLHVDEETYHETLVGGRANFILSNLSVDLHNYSVSYPGDENYDGAGTGGCFNVFKATPEIAMLINGSMLAGDPIFVSIIVSNNASGNISVDIDGKIEAGLMSDGTINFYLKI